MENLIYQSNWNYDNGNWRCLLSAEDKVMDTKINRS